MGAGVKDLVAAESREAVLAHAAQRAALNHEPNGESNPCLSKRGFGASLGDDAGCGQGPADARGALAVVADMGTRVGVSTDIHSFRVGRL